MRRWALTLLATLFASSAPVDVARASPLSEATENIVRGVTVRVIADEDTDDPRLGSGFVWPDRDHVVTALHVVAGDDSVSIEYPTPDGTVHRREARAVMEHAYADLVLLRVTNAPPGPVAEIEPSPVEAAEPIWVVGYQNGFTSLYGRPLYVGRIRPSSIRDTLVNEADQERLEALGFPSPTLQVLFVEGEIQPGDSGAPIVDASGRIRAIGSGGLRSGTVGIGWVVPIAEGEYLTRSGEAPRARDARTIRRLVRNVYLFPGATTPLEADRDAITSYQTSFELVNAEGGQIGDFITSEPFFRPCTIMSAEYTAWRPVPQAHGGRQAINIIPSGNPSTERTRSNYCSGPTLAVSAAILDQTFTTRGSQALRVSMFVRSTSNPRPRAVHNCDSSLNVFVSRDDEAWEHYSAFCGHHASEEPGWRELRFDIPAEGADRMRLAFLYEVQNVDEPDPSAAYLIDDLSVRAVPTER